MDVMPQFHPEYVTDSEGNKKAVILPIGEYEELLEDLEDLAFAADRKNVDNRKNLRETIRNQVARIELFRRLPERCCKALEGPKSNPKLVSLKTARCVRLVFRNDAERWVIDRGDGEGFGVRFDGATPPPLRVAEMVNDELGGKRLLDMRENTKLAPIKFNDWKATRAAGRKTARATSRKAEAKSL